jgi:hypothetical protein
VGPIALCDKSFIEMLNVDEAAVFDALYSSVICPVFFTEVLADLSLSEVAAGDRAVERIVGDVAKKTPVMHSTPNLLHTTICLGEMMGHPGRRKCISAYSYSLLRLVSAILVLPMPIRLSAERQPFDIIALPKKYRNIFESIPIAYGVVAVVMIARASLAPSKMLNTTLKKQFLDIARTADRGLTAMSAG